MNSFKWTWLISFLIFAHAERVFHDSNQVIPVAHLTADQKSQVKELLGQLGNRHSSVDVMALTNFVQKRLPKVYKQMSPAIVDSLLREAKRNGLDPLFLVAVIMTESSFNPKAVGRHGEIGLMQIRPKTAEWVARKFGHQGHVNLNDPLMNIKIGAFYLSKLRKKFSRVGNRYVAAYNMGSRNVRRLVSINKEPKIYPDRVLGYYKSLHKEVSRMVAASAGQKLASN